MTMRVLVNGQEVTLLAAKLWLVSLALPVGLPA